jgi:hypothetical protein
MKQFTAIVHRGEPEEGGFWATCLEVPGANGQRETKDECLRSLSEAIQLIDIKKHLARSICRRLSVPIPPGD